LPWRNYLLSASGGHYQLGC